MLLVSFDVNFDIEEILPLLRGLRVILVGNMGAREGFRGVSYV